MKLLYPWVIAVLVPPMAALAVVWRARSGRIYSSTALLKRFRSSWPARVTRLVFLAAAALMVLALARPQLPGGTTYVMTKIHDTVILIDKSGSMDQPYNYDPATARPGSSKDNRPSKYDIGRRLASEFIALRSEDRITAFVFNDFTFGLIPLTKKDHQAIQEWLRLPDRAAAGTNIDDAVIASLKHLDEMGQSGDRTLIVLSDGEGSWSDDTQLEIFKLVTKTHTRVFWIYVEAPQVIKFKRESGTWLPSQEGLLWLATATGGAEFDAGSEDQYQAAFDAIAKLQTEPALVALPVANLDLYPYFIGAAVVLFAFTQVLLRLWVR